MKTNPTTNVKKFAGLANHIRGVCAEESVARAYEKSGFSVVDRRWRSQEGEIDLVARHENKLYFVEVKSSKSHQQAALALTQKVQRRVQNAARRYLAQKFGRLDVDCRFDAALVDAVGRVKVYPNAF